MLIKEPEATFVRYLFTRYLELKSVPAVSAEVTRQAIAAEREEPTSSAPTYTRRVGSGMLYNLLSNPIYVGKLKHRDNVHDGEHQAIIDPEVFAEVQHLLAVQAATPRGSAAHADVHLLTGLVFDDTGDRMSPTHAKAHGKRYRYYISSRIKGTRRVDTTAWRIPAIELESVVLRSLTRLLGDRSQLVDWITSYAPSADIQHCLNEVPRLRDRLATEDVPDRRGLLQAMLHRITLGSKAITLTINAAAVVGMLQSQTQIGVASTTDDHDHLDPLTAIDLPVTIKRRGNEICLVIDNDLSRIPDAALVNLVVRANLYLQHLTRAPRISVTDVAKGFGVHRADVGRILPLAFLAPRLIDQILKGTQPDRMSARRLARANLPQLWTEQLTALS